MKIDTRELQYIVESTKVARLHLYTTIHKALRANMSEVLTSLGQMDCNDDQHCQEVMDDLQQLLHVLHGHVETENTIVHPAIEARNPGALAGILAEHADHLLVIEKLQRHTQTLLTLSGRERAAFGLFLYRELSRFVAENLEHMLDEENQNQQLLWSSYSDEELLAIHKTILASIPPEKMAVIAPWLISSTNADERLAMFMGMRATAPAHVLEGNLKLARSSLSSRDWSKLSSALGVAPLANAA